MEIVKLVIGPYTLKSRLECESAPQACASFRRMLPFRNRVIHVRWSGEAFWIPLGDHNAEIGYENHTSYPSQGEILFHPASLSETEILISYRSVSFASRVGPLAGNHFMTIIEGLELLPVIRKLVLWEGAQNISFELEQEAGS